MCHRSKNGTGGCAGPNRGAYLSSLGWEGNSLKVHKSLGRWLVILRKHLVCHTPKLIESQGNKGALACDLHLHSALASSLHGPSDLSSHMILVVTWPMTSRRKSSLSWQPGDALTGVSVCSHLGLHVIVQLSPSSCMNRGPAGSTSRLQERACNGQQPGTSYTTWMWTMTT